MLISYVCYRKTFYTGPKLNKNPYITLEGEQDYFVPCEMSKEIYNAVKSKKYILTIPGAGHGLGFIIDNENYNKKLDEFLKETLNIQLN